MRKAIKVICYVNKKKELGAFEILSPIPVTIVLDIWAAITIP